MIRLVIFDHSGVLVDDLRESWQAVSKIIGLRGYRPDDMSAFRRNLRLPYWNYLMAKGFTEREAKSDGVVSDYIRYYMKTIEHVKLFGEVEEALAALAEKNCELAVVSHSPRETLDAVMKKFMLDRYFKRNCVFALEDYKSQKPHPESIELALRKLGYPSSDALYVGDMREDIIASRRAGVKSIAIYRDGSSYHLEKHLREENPTFMIRDLRDVSRIAASLSSE